MLGMRFGLGMGLAAMGQKPPSGGGTPVTITATLNGQALAPDESVAGFLIYSFTTPTAGTDGAGTFEISAETAAEVLIIGGGGGGGGRSGGGGGAGGFLELVGENAITLAADTEYAIVIGKGGAAHAIDTTAAGNDGVASSIIGGALNLVADGGGGGGATGATSGRAGGSGGGAAAGGTGGAASGNGTGNAGGTTGAGQICQGGGGGAGEAGQGGGAGIAPQGNGGAGVQSSITGAAVYYSAGGGGKGKSTYSGAGGTGNEGGTGALQVDGNLPTAGLPENRGHGGGGGNETTGERKGAKGSDGIVIIKIAAPPDWLSPTDAYMTYGGSDHFIYESDSMFIYDRTGV